MVSDSVFKVKKVLLKTPTYKIIQNELNRIKEGFKFSELIKILANHQKFLTIDASI